MNIVKGVADLIRRTSSVQAGESSGGSSAERFSFTPPAPKIRFSEVGDEEVLHTLWERYENTADKVEKRKLFYVFLKQFLIVHKNWEPDNLGQFSEAASTAVQTVEYSSHFYDIVVGCSAGHPAEFILILTEELTHLTALINEITNNMVRSTDLSGASSSFNITSEGFPVLDALTIITRSMHNCKVFGYYGGIQKLTALMKGAVVQLKTITGALSTDENSSNFSVEKTRLLQQMLLYVALVLHSFIDLNSNIYNKAQFVRSTTESSFLGGASSIDSPSNLKLGEIGLQWQQKAVVSVMEAGGLNWLVELLRVIRRLSMKEQWTDISLQFLTLRTLHLALSANPRGQNHFKSIGGLEVLLDGLALPSNSVLLLKHCSYVDEKR